MTRPRQISDEKLLEVARSVFLEQGAGASTAVVAERAGISQGVLFQRFGTKEQLLIKALEPPRDVSWIERAEAGPDERDLRDQMRELGEDIAEHLAQVIPALMVLRAAGLRLEARWGREEGAAPPPLRGLRVMRAWFEAAKAQGRLGEVDPSALALAFVGALQSWVMMRHLAGEGFDEGARREHLESLIELLWRGIAPGGRSS